MTTNQVLLTRSKPAAVNPINHVAPDNAFPPTINSEQVQMIDQRQSLGVIQTLLAASIGSLAYLRGLFPDDCFVKMRYGVNRTATDYHVFSMASEERIADRETERRGTKVTRLARGRSREADRLLDWLERGAFQALLDGQLKALQLALYLEESQPNIVSESYTFSFSYLGGTNVPELEITDIHGFKVTINEASKGAQQMTRRLLTITEDLPPLPDNRWLTMRMHYHDSTPAEYSPPGFVRLPHGSAGLIILGDERQVQRQHCGTMNSGHHSVSLKISCAQTISSQSPRHRRSVSRFYLVDNDIEAPKFDFKRPNTMDISLQQSNLLPRIQNLSGSPPESNDDQKERSINSHLDISITSSANQRQQHHPRIPQSKEVFEKTILNEMLAPEKMDTDWLPTQPVFHTTIGYNCENVKGPISGKRLMEATLSSKEYKRVRHDERRPVPKMILNKITAIKLFDRDRKETELRSRSRRSQAHKITCECGYSEEDGGMICCDICDGWQHAHCYGFTSALDGRLADLHCCYSCLLRDEQHLLSEMKELALFRRALRFVWDCAKVPSTTEAFAAEVGKCADILLGEVTKNGAGIGCDTERASLIIEKLESEGFIRNKRKRADGQAQTKCHRRYLALEAVKTEQTRRLETEYFNPLMKIGHHVCTRLRAAFDYFLEMLSVYEYEGGSLKSTVQVLDTQPRPRKFNHGTDQSAINECLSVGKHSCEQRDQISLVPESNYQMLQKDSQELGIKSSRKELSSVSQSETGIFVGIRA